MWPTEPKDLSREAKHNQYVFIPLINKWSQLVHIFIAKDSALLIDKTDHPWIKTTESMQLRGHYSKGHLNAYEIKLIGIIH